jgi:carbon-monoxide dehydrogenase medium subunit
MKDFEYYRPTNVSEAVALLAANKDGRAFSGGMSLLPTMKLRLGAPTALVDLSALPGMTGITIDAKSAKIGGMTTHAEVADSTALQAGIPGLAVLASLIGDPQVRHRGTLGGSLANADPAADYPAAALGLGATIITDRREIAADDFFTGMFQTALAEDEIIVAVRFPIPDVSSYAKFKSQASRFALVGAFVAKFGGTVRVAITGAAPVVFRAVDIEAALTTNFSPAALTRISIDPSGLNSDIHADSEYRAHLVVVMASRAVEQALLKDKPS